MSGMCNFPCQGLALLETVPRPPITIGITVTLDALWILFYCYYHYYVIVIFITTIVTIVIFIILNLVNNVLKKIKKVSFTLGKFSVARSNRDVTQCLFRHL